MTMVLNWSIGRCACKGFYNLALNEDAGGCTIRVEYDNGIFRQNAFENITAKFIPLGSELNV